MEEIYQVFREAGAFVIGCYTALPAIIRYFFEFVMIWIVMISIIHIVFNLK